MKQYTYQQFKDSVEKFDENYSADITAEKYFGFPLAPILEMENGLRDASARSIAYFSMEYGLAPSIYNTFSLSKPLSEHNTFYKHDVFSNYWVSDYVFKIHIDKMLDIPIYGGGLGVLAGDTMKSAADLRFSMVAIGILWNKGYFKQNFWYKHGQVPEEMQWDPATYPGLVPLTHRVTIDTKEGPLQLRLWKYYIYSYDRQHACPLILLDSNVEENPEHLRKLTDQLYRSDHAWWKIFQRVILGIGGMKALTELGYAVSQYHLNEGHAAFALLEKYRSLDKKAAAGSWKEQFAYTCHTPVAAGHDRFSVGDLAKILDDGYVAAARQFGAENESRDGINLTLMALNNCPRVNAVAAKHGEIMRLQFPQFAGKIRAITNGVHTHTWVSESFAKLFDAYGEAFGNWREQPENLRGALALTGNKKFREDVFAAHQENKKAFMEIVKPWRLKEDVLTVGWARRIAGYKRPVLIFHDIERLIKTASTIGPIQIVMAGKAHPNDNIAAAHVDTILNRIDKLNDYSDNIKVLILENYDTFFGKLLTNSVDVWLNNPLPPFEASGTSGMKAIANGVLQMTTLDGWVVEAEKDDIGWIFGYRHSGPGIGTESDLHLDSDSRELHDTLEKAVELYYKTYTSGKLEAHSQWIDKMIHCIACSAFFNTHRMIKEYDQHIWKATA